MSRRAFRASLGWLLVFTCAAQHAASQETTKADPAIRAAVQPFIDQREIAGAVTVVVGPEGILHLDAQGQADIASSASMRPDTIFAIASMTKPITATAVLMLQDAHELNVDDPVSKYIPEFAHLRQPDGRPANLTIRHLLTHTSGLAEISAEQARACRTLADTIPLYLSRPVRFAPGTKWSYSQSSINTAARVVEVVSGEPFDEFLQTHLFEPLGMKDTTFYLSDAQVARLATAYKRNDAGTLEVAPLSVLLGKTPSSRDRFPAANGGLFSTGPDYARFARMILNGGELDGKRYVTPESIALMTTNQTGDLPDVGHIPGSDWGLGWGIVRVSEGGAAMLSPGTFGHGGAYGTQAWIDPTTKRAYILMVQRTNFPNSDASEVRKAFQGAAVEALSGD